MSKSSDIHKSFSCTPYAVCDKEHNVLDREQELNILKQDIYTITELSLWTIHNCGYSLLEDIKNYDGLNPSEAGRQIGIRLPEEMRKGKSFSRFEKLYQDRVVRELRSWKERALAASQETKKHVSQGWSRTVNNSIPTTLKPKFSLSSVDKSYAFINNNPYDDGFIELYMKINTQWRILYFAFDLERFQGSHKISLPDVTIKNGNIRFNFTAVYEYIYSDISSNYVIAVDVGKTNYVTVAVIRTSDNSLVKGTETTLSPRVHSLYNSCVATSKQVTQLQKQGRKKEAKLHRKANVKKKRELAILAAQEITDIASMWDNAVVVVEDLSWINNTMQNGRWNRGELIKWINHYS